MTDKTKSPATLSELRETAQHVRNVLVDNAKTNTVVYGLLLSLEDDAERGAKPKTIKKEFQDAILLAQEQYYYLFFGDSAKIEDE